VHLEIEAKHAAPIADRAERIGDPQGVADIVDDDGGFAEFGQYAGGEALRFALIGDVGDKPAVPLRAATKLDESLLNALGIPGGKGDLHPLLGEFQADGFTDAGGTAGDESLFSFDS
jgi:hypothetical protein